MQTKGFCKPVLKNHFSGWGIRHGNCFTGWIEKRQNCIWKTGLLKGFKVIQAVILAELDGLDVPNPYGENPLIDNDPLKPNEGYFKHVDYIIRKAEKLGLVMAILPSWGDKWNKASWGKGPEIFTSENARAFGEFLGKRFKSNSIVWVLGGDRAIENQEDRDIITAMAEGLRKGDGGIHLQTFHPPGDKSSYDFFVQANWIDFHMSQSGHSTTSKNYKFNIKNTALTPLRPHLDGEPRYEDHPASSNDYFGMITVQIPLIKPEHNELTVFEPHTHLPTY